MKGASAARRTRSLFKQATPSSPVAAPERIDDGRQRNFTRRPRENVAAVRAPPRGQHAGAHEGLKTFRERGSRERKATRDAGQLVSLAGARSQDRQRLHRMPQRRGKTDEPYIRILHVGDYSNKMAR